MSRRGRRGRPPARRLHQKVKTARGRKAASTRWLQRQLNDPYVAEAERRGYRSRAAFKLIELDDRFHVLAPGRRVLDLGAAPGGWTQVAVERVRAGAPGGGRVVAVDRAPMDPVPGAELLHLDAEAPDAPERIRAAMGGAIDVVLSDMSPAATGHAATDHLRIVGLCEAALDLADRLLAPGGAFVAKVFQGGAQGDLLAALKRRFASVRHAKPPASRPESAEMYVVASGYRGAGTV